jgi:hypothetical protein
VSTDDVLVPAFIVVKPASAETLTAVCTSEETSI